MEYHDELTRAEDRALHARHTANEVRNHTVQQIQLAADIIQKLDQRGELIVDSDGFYYYLPQNIGYLSSFQLRVIANELDRRNEAWNKNIEEYFEKQKKGNQS